MDDNAAMKHAWDQLCEKLDAKDWTIGEKFPRECFFIHGWNARTAWDAHRSQESESTSETSTYLPRVFLGVDFKKKQTTFHEREQL